jgi:hypothetical protein
MFDLDPRDYDSRDGERHSGEPIRGRRGGSDHHDRDGNWRQSGIEPRVRDDDDARTLGRGRGNDRQAVIREELETPLHTATISQLKWYFERRRKVALRSLLAASLDGRSCALRR